MLIYLTRHLYYYPTHSHENSCFLLMIYSICFRFLYLTSLNQLNAKLGVNAIQVYAMVSSLEVEVLTNHHGAFWLEDALALM